MASLFFSYSHKDESLRNELEVHLAMLKREGTIEAWHDRKIVAGDELDKSISAELEKAEVILLLVSPDFLASQYCYEVEFQRAMERHVSGSARAVAVILRPCEWQQTPLSKFLVTPTDGRPARTPQASARAGHRRLGWRHQPQRATHPRALRTPGP